MAYQVVNNLTGPDAVLAAIRDFAVGNGWTILENLYPDLPLDGTAESDGLRLTLQSAGSGDIIANFRSANGKKIFEDQNNTSITSAYGIGLTCSTGYTSNPPSGKWFDQVGVTKHGLTQRVIGVGIPIAPAKTCNVYLNAITDPEIMLLISVEYAPGIFQHLAVGLVQKASIWTGGTIYSGSRNSVNMFTSSSTFDPVQIESESGLLFGMQKNANTFLRADIDSASLRVPAVTWASAGADDTLIDSCFTGKMLALPVKQKAYLTAAWDPKIPHYAYLQSQEPKDTGRNVNTLNCITVNLPLAVYVQRDPDGLRNFSLCGYVPGVSYISTRNVAPAKTYEISYPLSGQLHQAFPYTRRGGLFGYDGFSIKQ